MLKLQLRIRLAILGLRFPRIYAVVTLVVMGTVGLGLLTIDRHLMFQSRLRAVNPAWRLRVFFNGRDVTNQLTAADDRRGWCAGFDGMFRPDGSRIKYLKRGQVTRFVRTGAVEYRLATS